MEIRRTKLFKEQFKVILENIAKDKVSAMSRFKKELNDRIDDLPNMPKKYRKSLYYDDENVRDMIFRGYTIIYKIDKKHITIVEIFHNNLPVLEELR